MACRRRVVEVCQPKILMVGFCQNYCRKDYCTSALVFERDAEPCKVSDDNQAPRDDGCRRHPRCPELRYC